MMMKIIGLLLLLISVGSCTSQNGANDPPESGENKSELIIAKSADEILNLPNSEDVLILRTDFSDDKTWSQLCELISESGKELGFEPYVEYLSDKKFEGLKNEGLLNRNSNYEHLFIFLVDSMSINHTEHPILCVDLHDKPGRYFRVIPSQMWGIENNLSISNIGFEEFYNTTDADGIHRGFK